MEPPHHPPQKNKTPHTHTHKHTHTHTLTHTHTPKHHHPQEINRIPNPLDEANAGAVTNFGWPCIEGGNSVSDIFQNFLK